MRFRDRFWTSGDIKELSGAAQDGLLAIENLVRSKQVAISSEVGWGQYLDDLHHSGDQWGILGTSAGFQVVARAVQDGSPSDLLDRVKPLLPDAVNDWDTLVPAVQAKAGHPKYDLNNIFRLAFIAEARAAEHTGTVVSPQPSLVEHIFRLANGPHWHWRSAMNGSTDLPGNAVTTAYVLHALRRYEAHPAQFRPFRVWLARQLQGDAKLRARPDYLALVGLALCPVTPDPQNPEHVRVAADRCHNELLRWRRSERSLVINRPMFEGYQLGETTDYLIFNPEVMAALLFLRSGNPRPVRGFVAATTREVTRSISANRGFEGQIGSLPTIDQEWASRLLHLFMTSYRDAARREMLLPGYATTARIRGLVYWTLVAALSVGLVLLGLPLIAGGGALFAGALINIAANWSTRGDG